MSYFIFLSLEAVAEDRDKVGSRDESVGLLAQHLQLLSIFSIAASVGRQVQGADQAAEEVLAGLRTIQTHQLQ